MRSYKEMWFDEYEKLDSMREAGEISGNDIALASIAHESAIDRIAEAIDHETDRRRDS